MNHIECEIVVYFVNSLHFLNLVQNNGFAHKRVFKVVKEKNIIVNHTYDELINKSHFHLRHSTIQICIFRKRENTIG